MSMSTSPQQTTTVAGQGPLVNLQQRYLAHKQQQQQQTGSRQFFTMSASMPIQYKSNQNPRARSVADVSQYCGGPSSLISTAVISGSSPELVAVCPYSPNIRPLETLHNELSLKPFIDFITRLTKNHRSSTISQVDNNLSSVNLNGQNSFNENVRLENYEGSLMSSNNSLRSNQNGKQQAQQYRDPINQCDSGKQLKTSNGQGSHQIGLSPGNSLSNSLIWSGPPSSFASSAGPSSPSGGAALEMWSKLELDDENCVNGNETNQLGGGTVTTTSNN